MSNSQETYNTQKEHFQKIDDAVRDLFTIFVQQTEANKTDTNIGVTVYHTHLTQMQSLLDQMRSLQDHRIKLIREQEMKDTVEDFGEEVETVAEHTDSVDNQTSIEEADANKAEKLEELGIAE